MTNPPSGRFSHQAIPTSTDNRVRRAFTKIPMIAIRPHFAGDYDKTGTQGDVRAGSTKRVAAAVGEGAAVVAQIHTMIAIRPKRGAA